MIKVYKKHEVEEQAKINAVNATAVKAHYKEHRTKKRLAEQVKAQAISEKAQAISEKAQAKKLHKIQVAKEIELFMISFATCNLELFPAIPASLSMATMTFLSVSPFSNISSKLT